MISHTSSSADRSRVLAGIAMLSLTVFFIYLPALNGGFLLDDDDLLTEAPLIRAADGLHRIWFTTESMDYWPVANSSFWLEWRLWGAQSTGYHCTNVLLHVISSVLIWAIARRLELPGAFAAALLFAVHPVNVETVAWIAQRKSLLAGVFFLLSVLLYLNAEVTSAPARPGISPEKRGGWYWLSLVAFVVAMLSKGTVAILPVILLGVVSWLRPLSRSDLIRTAPFFLIAAVLTWVNVWFQTHGVEVHFRQATTLERLLAAATAIWFYLSKAIVPVDLTFVYPQWSVRADQIRWWIPLLSAAGLSILLWRYRASWGRSQLFAWGYFCVMLLPVLGFVDVSYMEHSLVADHYQYLALVGVTVLVAGSWTILLGRTNRTAARVGRALGALVACVLMFASWRQSRLYVDGLTLYADSLRKNPNAWLMHNNLGGAFYRAGRLDEAIEHCREAVRLNPDYADAHSNLAAALRLSGHPVEAIEHGKQAVRLKPTSAAARNNLAAVLSEQGQRTEAIEQYEYALRLSPDFPDAHNNLGITLAEVGRFEEAIRHFEQALQLAPGHADARHNLQVARAKRPPPRSDTTK